MTLILVIDVGTTSLRAALVDEALRITDIEVRPTPPSTPFPGLVEFDPAEMAAITLDAAQAVLAAAPDQLAGAASGINNAVARSAGLLAIAVVPAVAGLSRAAADDAVALDRGFHTAMLIGAGLMGAAALVSWFGVGRQAAAPTPEGHPDLVPVHRQPNCGVCGPAVHPAQHR